TGAVRHRIRLPEAESMRGHALEADARLTLLPDHAEIERIDCVLAVDLVSGVVRSVRSRRLPPLLVHPDARTVRRYVFDLVPGREVQGGVLMAPDRATALVEAIMNGEPRTILWNAERGRVVATL